MAKTVIEVSGLSKIYDLGLVGTGTLSKDLNRAWAKLKGKPDPYATLAEINDRTQQSSSNTVLALKDINFEVEEGEVLGIIGRNGAGKSTLLKILSQITSPSSGDIKIKGRVASLLEVGTGMHPEMTAKQNIYLNGSIMGMTRREVTSKLDEIVDFAGINKYIDTPIKRFSSGMKVRLGFAVAAFLEPEILIVDEVLAVGDAEFQKRAVGKMKEVSKGQGRTVLFVSHNMASVKSLCNKSMLLDKGEIEALSDTESIINQYLKGGKQKRIKEIHYFEEEEFSDLDFRIDFLSVSGVEKKIEATIYRSDELRLRVGYSNNTQDLLLTFRFKDENGGFLFVTGKPWSLAKSTNKEQVEMIIPKNFFNSGRFYVDIQLSDGRSIKFRKENAVAFDVLEDKKIGAWSGKTVGSLKPDFVWQRC